MVEGFSGRVLYRANYYAGALGGLAYAGAYSASSYSNTYIGSRLELRTTCL